MIPLDPSAAALFTDTTPVMLADQSRRDGTPRAAKGPMVDGPMVSGKAIRRRLKLATMLLDIGLLAIVVVVVVHFAFALGR